MKKYFVSVAPDSWDQPGKDYGVIAAKTIEETKQKFLDWLIVNSQEYRDYITGVFCEDFMYHDSKFFFNGCGEQIAPWDELIESFKSNVKRYFSNNSEYADIYINLWLKAESLNLPLPEEIIQYIAKKEVRNYYGRTGIIAIPIDELMIGEMSNE